VSPEEIAQAHEGPDCLDIQGWFCILDCLELVFAQFDSFRRECESKIGHFLVSKHTFFQIYFKMVLMKLGQNLVKNLQNVFHGSLYVLVDHQCRPEHWECPGALLPLGVENWLDIPGVPLVKWSSGIDLCLGWWKPLAFVNPRPVAFARIQMSDPTLWKWWNQRAQCHRCIRWSLSWSTCRCVSSSWVLWSLVRSVVLGLVSLERRKWVSYRVSLIS